RPGAFWGPGERLAIPWYERDPSTWDVTFVDGQTGATATTYLPSGRRPLPAWASDGTGIAIGRDGSTWRESSGLLFPGGWTGSTTRRTLEPACHDPADPTGRDDDDATYRCESPNGAMRAMSSRSMLIDPASTQVTELSSEITGDRFTALGRFAGWM